MDAVLFLAMCAIVLFISGGLIFTKFGEIDGLVVIALGLAAVASAIYETSKRSDTSP